MNSKKGIVIITILFIVLEIGTIYFFYKLNKKVIDNIYTIETKNNESTIQILEGSFEDEKNIEKQEVEEEGFKLQGEIAYNGNSEIPNIKLGEYAGLTYYSQIDNRWKNLPYTITGNSNQTIGISGCGPACAAMVVSSIKGTITPPTMAELFVKYGFRSKDNRNILECF